MYILGLWAGILLLIAGAEYLLYLHLRRKLMNSRPADADHFDMVSINSQVRLLFVLIPVIASVLTFTGFDLIRRTRDDVTRNMIAEINKSVEVWFVPNILIKKQIFGADTALQGSSKNLGMNELVDNKGMRVPLPKGKHRYILPTARNYGTPLINKMSADSFEVYLIYARDKKDSAYVDLMVIDLDTTESTK